VVWFGPAVKYTSVAGAAAASLLFGLTFPGLSAQTPLMGQRLPTSILQQSVKFSGSQVVSGDESTRLSVSATRELPDEQVVAETSEIEGSQSHAPRSVQPITMLETPQEPACRTVNIHKA